MLTVCPTGGSYWDPRPCWWLTESPLCLLGVRVYNVFRVALWLVGRVVDAVFTLFFGILLPFLRLLLTFVASFVNFMIGLLLGEFRVDFGVFFPVAAFFGAWFLWFFWPQIGCFIENLFWPFLVGLVRSLALVVRLLPSIYNVMVRVYNNCVPAFGFFLYIVVKLLVMFMSFVVQLLGEFNVWELFHSLFEIWIILCEIFIEVFAAVIAQPDSTLYATVTQIGPIITVLFNVIRIVLAVIVWLFGKLWRVLEPLLDQLVRVVRAVKKHLLLRRLLGLDVRLDAMPDGDSAYDLNADIWAGLGQAAQRYWTDESATEFMHELADVNRWTLEHPPDEYNDYFWFRHQQLLGSSKPPPRPPDKGGGRHLFASGLPAGWDAAQQDEPAQPSARPTSAAEVIRALGEQAERYHRAAREHKVPHLADEVRTHRVQCRSSHCGKHGAPLPHPLEAAARHQHEFGFGVLRPEDPRGHRRRLTHAFAAFTAARRATRELFDEHWHRGTGELPRHTRNAWRALTGHSSLHETFEYATTQRPDPVDSVASFVPVVGDWWPVAWIKQLHPDENRTAFYSEWMAERAVGYNQSEIARTGRALLHVTIDPVSPAAAAASHAQHRRGAWTPEGEQSANLQPAETPTEVPSVPVLQLLYASDCYVSRPRNPLCLPEIPPQLGCLIERLLGLFPSRLPVELCGYEEECADLGFCIIDRPPLQPRLIVIYYNLDLWVSSCWLKNGVVWIGVALAVFLPIIKLTLQIFKLLLPFLSWFFDAFIQLIPDTVTLQDAVCLIIFFYGLVLLIVLFLLFRIFVLPLLGWLWRTWNSLETMFSALRSIEATRLAYVQESGAQRLLDRMYEVPPGPVLWRDPWTHSPFVVPPPDAEQLAAQDPLYALREQQSRLWTRPAAGVDPYIPFVPAYTPNESLMRHVPAWLRPSLTFGNASGYTATPLVPQQPLGDELLDGDEPLSTEQRNALDMYQHALAAGERLFGRPPRVVTGAEAHDFDHRFMPLIQSAHYSHSWFRRWAAERDYQREAARSRRPAAMPWFRGATLGAQHP